MEVVQGMNFKGQNYWDNIEIFPSLLNHTNAAVQNTGPSGQVFPYLMLPVSHGEWGDCLRIVRSKN